jgi:hypothetical protein
LKTKVIFKTHDDLEWGFDSKEPSVTLRDHNSYARTTYVDPFPAYAHNLALVAQQVKEVTDAFPITWPVTFYILSNEVTSRTNAWAVASDHDYNKPLPENAPEKYERTPYIVFSGKRIPIMPAMTRYLVAHEYGHIVEDWVAYQRGQKDGDLLREYAALRGVEFPKSYGGGTWHATPGEIFANDFRILVTKKEAEFWPHPCSHPSDTLAVIGWWEKAKELLNK